jgi:ABC-type multidrug transport system ATPase subunit
LDLEVANLLNRKWKSMFCLETKDLGYRYSRDGTVLESISLQVPERSIYGFLGPNGAGKTTTLRLVLGLLKKQRGTISIFQKPLDANRLEILRAVGSLIESPSLYAQLTAAENLTVLQKVYRCPKSRIGEVLDLVGLGDTGNKKTGQFSLGMKQRLSIAVALLHSPSLLILDEPTNGLDPRGIIEMRELLLRLNTENRVTIVISSHLLAEIEKLVTHLGIIHRGRMVFQGTIGDLRHRQPSRSICFGTNDNERALAIIMEHSPNARRAEGHVVVPAMSNQELAQINRSLVEGGLSVHEILPGRNDLESIFMSLVGE